MCNCLCCQGTCRLCGDLGGFVEFPEPITKVDIREIVDKDGCRLEELIINDKWKMVQNPHGEQPFRIEEIKTDRGCDKPGTKLKCSPGPLPIPIPIPDYQRDIWDLLREKNFNPIEALPTAMIKRIEDMGRCREKLKSILDDDIFEMLSKHNPYWDSKHAEEEDKLDYLRMKLTCISDNLWDLMQILQNDED